MFNKRKFFTWFACVACSLLVVLFLKNIRTSFGPLETARRNYASKTVPESSNQADLFKFTRGSTVLLGKVVAIHDGDTLTLRTEDDTLKVRLSGIDTPEIGQPFGNSAKQALSGLVFGKSVAVDSTGKDRYGRTLGTIFSANRDNINEFLVRQGMAWWYEFFAPEDSNLKEAQQEAMQAKRGLWADNKPIPPWEWRRGKR